MVGDEGEVTRLISNDYITLRPEGAQTWNRSSAGRLRRACGPLGFLLNWTIVCEIANRLWKRAVRSKAAERGVVTGLVCSGLLILGLSTSCAEPPPVEMSLLTGDPCEPPCWQGLTPGKSTEDDVLQFIRSSRFVDTRTVYRGRLSRGGGEVVGVSIQWRSTAARSSNVDSNDFLVEGGVLRGIIIYPDYDVTLESLLQRYGPPAKYHVAITGRHLPVLRVRLFYPARGFTATLELPIDEPVLGPQSTVIQVWYSKAAPLESFIELGISYLGSAPERWLQSLREWQGYGTIEVP